MQEGISLTVLIQHFTSIESRKQKRSSAVSSVPLYEKVFGLSEIPAFPRDSIRSLARNMMWGFRCSR